MKIGDKVMVTNSGRLYPFYKKMFKSMRLIVSDEITITDGDVGEVITIQPHLDFADTILVGVKGLETDFCINIEGLEVIEESRLDLKTIKNMKITEKRVLEVNGVVREITLTILNEGLKLRAGYSVRMPNDEPIEGLSEKIAEGRALSDKTNLVDMELGKGMVKKYILRAVLESLFKQVERGVIQIKGVK